MEIDEFRWKIANCVLMEYYVAQFRMSRALEVRREGLKLEKHERQRGLVTPRSTLRLDVASFYRDLWQKRYMRRVTFGVEAVSSCKYSLALSIVNGALRVRTFLLGTVEKGRTTLS